MPKQFTLFAFVVTMLVGGSFEQVHSQYNPKYPEPLPSLEGTLFLHGGGVVDSEMRARFTQLAGGEDARIIVIPTADLTDPLYAKKLDVWREQLPKSVEFLHAKSRDEIANSDFETMLANATGVWFSGGKQSKLVEIYGGTIVEDGVMKLLSRGGVVGGTSAGAAVASKVMLVYDDYRTGFDFLPGAIVDQHFTQRKRTARLRQAVNAHPERVGFGIDERTGMIIQGRRIEVMGEGNVHIAIAASIDRLARSEILKPGMQADLIALRRAAQSRQALRFPRTEVTTPSLPNGSLLIAGGGKLPAGIFRQFVRLAGGDQARIIYIPCSEKKVITEVPSILGEFRNAGAPHVEWLHTKDRSLANDPTFVAPLEQATGIWFGGGRQWNFVDSYQNTEAHRLMHRVLERGGVVGGSSAGASIQGDYMPRGDPLGNTQMMAEGYEQGLGFLTGVAVDQHFTQRGRFPDMKVLKRAHPQLLGIGIDEGTCLLVQESEAEVIGTGRVAFFDRPVGSEEIEAYTSLVDGDVYDLVSRSAIIQKK
jgi:cyanophycinase